MSKPLAGRTAVITGASHGLGKALALHLAELGAQVALVARRAEPLQATVAEIQAQGGQAQAHTCDISDKDQVQACANALMQDWSAVDMLINNAGVPAPRSFDATTLDDWDAVIGINLTGAFYMARALWDGLIASGRAYVITVSGGAGLRGSGSPAYGAAKFGLTGLHHAIAVAGKDHGLRATILYPGSMDTGWRGAPIGEKPRTETMAPDDVARYIGQLVTSPQEFVVNEAILNPIAHPFT